MSYSCEESIVSYTFTPAKHDIPTRLSSKIKFFEDRDKDPFSEMTIKGAFM